MVLPGSALDEPLLPPPEDEPEPAAGALDWVRINLFSTWYNGLLTVVFAVLLGWVATKTLGFAFLTGRWEIVRVNLTNFVVGPFPRDELYRVWGGAFVVALAAGVIGGARRRRAPEPLLLAVRRALPLLLLAAVLLGFARTVTPALCTLAAAGLAAAGYAAGRRLRDRATRRLWLVWLAAAVGFYAVLTSFGGIGWDEWGGLLLTLFLAVGGILLSFPLGVLLALGRRSTLPAVRLVCVVYIEIIRGVPLIAVLFVGVFALQFLVPPALSPSDVTRALIAFIAFTGAYLAEVVRGGLQSIPKGQLEAAQAIGLSPVSTTRLVVLPQALRAVIPGIVGQFISLFKDTSLVAIVGLTEVLGIAQVIQQQPAFLAQGLQAEALTFACLIYWAFCYSMSRASQRLERRLGVGER
jgi:general L-amino acid transport system permease protein